MNTTSAKLHIVFLILVMLSACGKSGPAGDPDGDLDPGVDAGDPDVTDEPPIPSETWISYIAMDDSRRYGNGATVTGDGGVAFVGFKEGTVDGLGDAVWIVKLTEHGEVEWSRYAGGADWADGIAEGASGTLVVAGSTSGADIYLLELDLDGNATGQRVIDTPGRGRALDIKPLEDGGFAIVAQANVTPWVARLDDRLEIVWQRRIGGVLLDYRGAALALAENGDLIVFCRDAFTEVAWLGRLDPAGEIVWQREITGTMYELTGVGVSEMTDGDVAVTISNHGGLCVLRFDAAGTLAWQRRLGGEWGYPITSGDDGRILVAGCSHETDSYDMWMLGLDVDGDILWQKDVHVMGEDSAHWMGRTPDGAVVAMSGGCCQTIVAKLTERGEFYGHCENLVDTTASASPAEFAVTDADATLTDDALSCTSVEPEMVDAPAEASIFCDGSR